MNFASGLNVSYEWINKLKGPGLNIILTSSITCFLFSSGGSVEDVGKMHEVLACHIFCKVLAAVDFMHSQGIIHRDVKGQLLACYAHT